MNEKLKCPPHSLGTEEWGRDDMTVQLKCLDCGQIVSIDSRDYDNEMSRLDAEDWDDEPTEDEDQFFQNENN